MCIRDRSKLVRKQILCDIYTSDIKIDCVFLIIPNLIRNCILGISFMKDERCLIDVEKGVVEFRGREEEQNVSIPIVHLSLIHI